MRSPLLSYTCIRNIVAVIFVIYIVITSWSRVINREAIIKQK